jgi:hypothetical protein
MSPHPRPGTRRGVPPATRIGGLLVAVMALLVLAGCSSGVRVGYNQAELLVNWTLSDYVDFEPHQRDLFGQKFRALHDWHRREQLPEYARLLRETRTRVENGLSRADVEWIIARSRGRLEALVEQGAGDAADLMLSLTPEQVKGLERSFVRANQKTARAWGVGQPAAEQQKKRAERLVAQVERFTGKLSREQAERVAEMANAMPLNTEQRFAERQRRQRELIAALQSGRNRAEMAAWFREWAPNWERGRDPATARSAQAAAEQRAQVLADIDRLLTPAQRRQAMDRLQAFSEDFIALSGTGASRQQRASN